MNLDLSVADISGNLHCGHCEEPLKNVDAARLHDCFLGLNTINIENNGALMGQHKLEVDDGTDAQTAEAEEASWTEESINALLTSYDNHDEDRHHPIRKKKLWDLIAQDLCNLGYKITPLQAKWKWWYLTKRYKDALVKMKVGERCKFRYLDRISEIFRKQEERVTQPGKGGSDPLDNAADDDLACWTDSAISAFLDAYENRYEDRLDPAKKKIIWNMLASDLKEAGYKMSPQQIRWKWMYLLKKHKNAVFRGEKAMAKFRFFNRVDYLVKQKTRSSPPMRTISMKPTTTADSIPSTSSNPKSSVKPGAIGRSRIDVEKNWVDHLKGLASAKRETIKIRQKQIDLLERLVLLREKELEDRAVFHRERMDIEERKLGLLTLLLNKN